MIIGGIQKTSFIDYPSKISCVVFTAGCNFECPYCHNPDLVGPIPEQSDFSPDEFLSFLKKRRTFLDGVVITGGEPTLQRGLFDFCHQIKNLGYPVKLDTNGSRPTALKELIDCKAVDYIAMDIKTDPARYPEFISKKTPPDAIRSSIRMIIDSGIAHEFRTTCVKPVIDANSIYNIVQLIKNADLYVLQKVQFNRVQVLHPDFFQHRNWRFEDEDLEGFKQVAVNFVKNCLIR